MVTRRTFLAALFTAAASIAAGVGLPLTAFGGGGGRYVLRVRGDLDLWDLWPIYFLRYTCNRGFCFGRPRRALWLRGCSGSREGGFWVVNLDIEERPWKTYRALDSAGRLRVFDFYEAADWSSIARAEKVG